MIVTQLQLKQLASHKKNSDIPPDKIIRRNIPL